AVEIVHPADDGGIDEALHQVRLLHDQIAARLDQRRIAVEAIVGEEKHLRLEAGSLFDGKGLRGDIALHRASLIYEKRLRVGRIGLHLLLAETVIRLEPLEIARDALRRYE